MATTTLCKIGWVELFHWYVCLIALWYGAPTVEYKYGRRRRLVYFDITSKSGIMLKVCKIRLNCLVNIESFRFIMSREITMKFTRNHWMIPYTRTSKPNLQCPFWTLWRCWWRCHPTPNGHRQTTSNEFRSSKEEKTCHLFLHLFLLHLLFR